ncbi:hypothetical protein [Hymenobacter tenuis]
MRPFLPVFLALSAVVLGTTACQKEDNEPTPEAPVIAQYKLDRMVHYPASFESSGVSHSPSAITGTVKHSGGGLELRFRSGDPSEDNVVFLLDYTKLTPGRVGKYPLKSVAATANPAQATYTLTYSSDQNSLVGKIYRASLHKTTGDLTISAYDARRGLISGTYALTMSEVPDPYADLTPNRPARSADIMVNGEFTNVPVQ